MRRPLILIITIVLMLIFIMIRFLNHHNDNQEVFKDIPPDIESNSGNIAVGLYEPNGKLIEEGSVLKYPEDGQLIKVISLSHFFDKEGDYGLIILRDFNQAEFEVDGKKHLMYPFIVKPNQTINIKTKIEIKKGIKELDYLVIKKPNYLLKEENIQKASFLQNVIAMRFLIEKGEEKKIPFYTKPFKTFDSPSTSLFISRSNNLKLMYTSKSNEEVFLSIGHPEGKNSDFAVVAFLNWKQVPLNSQKINYVNVEKEKREVFLLRLPQVSREYNYQVVSFPKPYQISSSDYGNQIVYGSPRIVLQP